MEQLAEIAGKDPPYIVLRIVIICIFSAAILAYVLWGGLSSFREFFGSNKRKPPTKP